MPTRAPRSLRVVVAGGHGQIALLLTRTLTDRGHDVVGIVRNPDHVADVEAVGGSAVVQDLEASDVVAVAEVLTGADAVVFAAGAGPGSTAERKYTVDRDASILLAAAAEQAGVKRFVQVSTSRAGSPAATGSTPVWVAYIDAKTQAEDALKATNLDWTILRAGALTNGPGTGRVTLAGRHVPRGTVPRADVATVLAELVVSGAAVRRTLELTTGHVPIATAVAATAQ
ncbi:NAD-dependent epimerase/dehydratase [Xylanimonas cellulosilytica DSM 15894]|uniref:NAD-dependent epimerase/dehydratase n=1 Tax=Xylanimonas cellulosilytica (strain DSM 15894 / JCM 12276 / CECT 5975 / KCTC 9989 / LMG 20990 / NBRC 107835 / XIL07) TaxID=446471 RepID=D1BU94_XYLCX|nr:SDR family oxidoreductase [Xylanimonas cellulosilytica]ACZ31107.1 NAD-dependent epimerase/dehydratase [Xylanimonas cellulosilytica DSM 15894]